MATDNKKILTAEQELKLRQPIDDYVGAIQQKINALRENGTDKVLDIQGELDNLKRDRIYTAQEKESIRAKLTAELEKAKAVESKNKDEIAKLIADAEGYLKGHFNKDYYQAVVESTNEEKALASRNISRQWHSSIRSIRPPFPSCLTSARSRTKNMSTKTGCLTPRCSWPKICRKQRIAGTPHLTISIT